MSSKFKRHFRVYLVNNHPAYIVDEEGNEYVFHRLTESKTSGDKKNWKLKVNPIKNCSFTCYIVKKEQRARKGRFSKRILETKAKIDVQYPWIKRAKEKPE